MQQPHPRRWLLGMLQSPADTLRNLRFNFNLYLVSKGTKIVISFPTPPPKQKKKRKKNSKTYQALRGLTNRSSVGWGAIVLAWSAIPNKLRVV